MPASTNLVINVIEEKLGEGTAFFYVEKKSQSLLTTTAYAQINYYLHAYVTKKKYSYGYQASVQKLL